MYGAMRFFSWINKAKTSDGKNFRRIVSVCVLLVSMAVLALLMSHATQNAGAGLVIVGLEFAILVVIFDDLAAASEMLNRAVNSAILERNLQESWEQLEMLKARLGGGIAYTVIQPPLRELVLREENGPEFEHTTSYNYLVTPAPIHFVLERNGVGIDAKTVHARPGEAIQVYVRGESILVSIFPLVVNVGNVETDPEP